MDGQFNVETREHFEQLSQGQREQLNRESNRSALTARAARNPHVDALLKRVDKTQNVICAGSATPTAKPDDHPRQAQIMYANSYMSGPHALDKLPREQSQLMHDLKSLQESNGQTPTLPLNEENILAYLRHKRSIQQANQSFKALVSNPARLLPNDVTIPEKVTYPHCCDGMCRRMSIRQPARWNAFIELVHGFQKFVKDLIGPLKFLPMWDVVFNCHVHTSDSQSSTSQSYFWPTVGRDTAGPLKLDMCICDMVNIESDGYTTLSFGRDSFQHPAKQLPEPLCQQCSGVYA